MLIRTLSAAAGGLVLAALALAAPAAAEDQLVATGRPQAAAPVSDDPIAQLNAIPDRGVDRGPEDRRVGPDGKMHGYMSASIGSRGYRQLAGGVLVPLGKDGDKGYLAAEFSTTEGGGRRH